MERHRDSKGRTVRVKETVARPVVRQRLEKLSCLENLSGAGSSHIRHPDREYWVDVDVPRQREKIRIHLNAERETRLDSPQHLGRINIMSP